MELFIRTQRKLPIVVAAEEGVAKEKEIGEKF